MKYFAQSGERGGEWPTSLHFRRFLTFRAIGDPAEDLERNSASVRGPGGEVGVMSACEVLSNKPKMGKLSGA